MHCRSFALGGIDISTLDCGIRINGRPGAAAS
jgi:hypothetical protein